MKKLYLLLFVIVFGIFLFSKPPRTVVYAHYCGCDSSCNCTNSGPGWCDCQCDHDDSKTPQTCTKRCNPNCGPDAVPPEDPRPKSCSTNKCGGCPNTAPCCYLITPTVTPTPTPTPPLVCQNLYASSLTPQLGDAITLTCEKNATYTAAVTYDFMLIKKDNKTVVDPNPLPTPFVKNSSNALTTYTFPTPGVGSYGYYLFMCRTCAGTTCTAWQSPSSTIFSENFESTSGSQLPTGWSTGSSNSGWGTGWGDNTGTASIISTPAGISNSTKSLQMVGHHATGTYSRWGACHSLVGIELNKTYSLNTSVYIPTTGTNQMVEILVTGWNASSTEKAQIVDGNSLKIDTSKKGSWQKVATSFQFTQAFVDFSKVSLCLSVWNDQQAVFDEVYISK